jgi:hypothetical protein
MKPAIHGSNWVGQGGEFTICGIAFDAHESGDVDEEVVFADPGQLVTCEDCRRTIAFIKQFKRYRQP